MFDIMLEIASNVWTWTWEGGSAWCLSGALIPCLLHDRPFSAMGDSKPLDIKQGTLGSGDKRLCMRLVLV